MGGVIDAIRKRVYSRNQNFLGIVCGPTGSGKSYFCLKFAEALNPEFSKEYIVFTPDEFIALINSDKVSKGSVIIFEEAGVGMPSKEWFSIQNKLMAYVMQTFRHRNFIVLFNVPNMSFVDNSIRSLFHMKFETKKIDRTSKQVIVKPFEIEYNDRFKKIYYKYPRVRPGGGCAMTLSEMRMGLPSKGLVKDYEQLRREYTDKLNREVEESLKKKKEKDESVNKESKKEKIIKLFDLGVKSPTKIFEATGIDYGYVKKILCDYRRTLSIS
jgi:hypothetical protein